mgnify:CR=1 FL=1
MADLEKTDTRKLAKEWNLPVFNKPESQDICFIPDNDYKGFLEKEKKDIFKPGDFVDEKAGSSAAIRALPPIPLASGGGSTSAAPAVLTTSRP